MDERKAFEAWQRSRKPSYPAEWEAWQTAWQAATAAERERCADICDQHASCEGVAQKCAAAIRKG